MKKFLLVIVGIMFACSVYAITVTNMGQVITITVLDEHAGADYSIVQDQSLYASRPGEIGTIVRFYSFDVDGGSTAITLKGGDVPDGMTVLDGYIDVVTAVTPITATTNVLTVGGITIGTLDSATADVAVLALNGNKTTNDAEVVMSQAVAPTAGVFRVVYRCMVSQ